MEFKLGGKEKNFIMIRVIDRLPKDQWHYYDDLSAEAIVDSDGYHATEQNNIESISLPEFLKGLKKLYEQPGYKVGFLTHHGWLYFELRGDIAGHIVIAGHIADQMFTQKLEFEFEIDQSYLPPAIEQLEQIIATYPFDEDSFTETYERDKRLGINYGPPPHKRKGCLLALLNFLTRAR